MTGEAAKAIELEGVVSALNVLRVFTADRSAILAELDRRIAETPGLFRGAPVIVDLTALEAAAEQAAAAGKGPAVSPAFPLATLAAALKERELVPVGASANSDANKRAVLTAGLALIDGALRPVPRAGKKGGAAATTSAAPPAAAPAAAAVPAPAAAPAPAPVRAAPPAAEPPPEPNADLAGPFALTLTQPLRAGQIVYAEARDAIALAAVNAGAELIADGNIHVYAPLRGRALAGAGGNEQARIYCQKLEADLVSIAGVYLSKDALPSDKLGKAVQIFLRNGELIITELAAR